MKYLLGEIWYELAFLFETPVSVSQKIVLFATGVTVSLVVFWGYN